MSFFKDIFKKLFSLKSIFVILTLSLVPVFCAYAAFDPVGYLGGVVNGGFNWVGSQGGEMAKGIIAAVIVAFSQFAIWILSLSLWFLNWTSSGDFINGDVVGMTNPIISVGWTAMRNIANILLIFGLVAIAISIMLGYEETKAKKMLITFVWIALLINFTPVICNAFVDIAQIIMKSFLNGGVSDTLVYQISENIKSPQKTELIAPTMVLFIFSLFASFIYVLYGILFLIRYIQIWMLVIISPVAFATHAFPEKVSSQWLSKILPPQCFWDRWWDDFLKYTFIGVPAAFSIYLSNIMMAAVQKNPQVLTSTPSGGVVEAGFSTLFSYIIPFAVLVQGFFMTMETGSQIGGNTLKGVYSSVANKTKGVIKRNTLDRAGNTITAGLSGAKENWAAQRSEMREQKRAGTADTGTAAWFKRRGASAKATIRGGASGAWTATGVSDIDKSIEDRKIVEKTRSDAAAKVKVLSKTQQEDILKRNNTSTPQKRAEIEMILAAKAKKGSLNDDNEKLILQNQTYFSKDTKEEIMKKLPHLVPELSDPSKRKMSTNVNPALRTAEQKKFDDTMINDFIRTEMTKGEVKRIQANSALKHGNVLSALKGDEFQGIIDKIGREDREEIQAGAKKVSAARGIINGTVVLGTAGISTAAEARTIANDERKTIEELKEKIKETMTLSRDPSLTPAQRADAIAKKNEILALLEKRKRLLYGMNL